MYDPERDLLCIWGARSWSHPDIADAILQELLVSK